MVLKLILLLLASFLLVSTRASYIDEDLLSEVPTHLCRVEDSASTDCSVTTPPPHPPVQIPVLPPSPDSLVLPIAPVEPPAEPPIPTLACVSKCIKRCKWHLWRRVCFWGCMKCCGKCKCVPPGIYGNRDKCGKCYTDLTNRFGRHICP